MIDIEQRLSERGIILPPTPKLSTNYFTCLQMGNLVYSSGVGCFIEGKPAFTGKVGSELTIEQACQAARVTMLNLLSMVKERIGDLDRVERVVKVLSFINCTEDFRDQQLVMKSASDLIVEVFGEKGRNYDQTSLGVSDLSFNLPVEIEVIVQVK